MDETEARTRFYKAKIGFQAEIESIERNSTVDFTNKEGKRKKYDYVDLAAVLDYALPKLAKHGLALSAQSVYREVFNERKNGDQTERVYVRSILGMTATITEVEGGYSETETVWHEAADMRDIKDRGGLITYMRRYAIMTLLGLSAKGEDDEVGSGGQPKQTPAPAPAKTAEQGTQQKPRTTASNAKIKSDFEAIGLTEQEMVSLRMANVGSMAAVVGLYEKHGKDKVAMLKAVNGEGSQEPAPE